MKYIFKNKLVSVGDPVELFGKKILLNDDTIPLLLVMKVIKEVTKAKLTSYKDIAYYINIVANKNDWDIDKTYDFFKSLAVYPGEFVSVLLREIALDFDLKYDGNIRSSNEIYVIDKLSGGVVKLNKSSIKSYNYFAAFRTETDAYKAKSILKPFFKDMY